MDLFEIVTAFVVTNWRLIIVLSFVLRYFISRETRNVPPGPTGVPILGYIPFLSDYSHLDLIKLGKKYGNIFRLVHCRVEFASACLKLFSTA